MAVDSKKQVSDLKAELGPLKTDAEQAKKDRKALQVAEENLGYMKEQKRATVNRSKELEQLLRVREATIRDLQAQVKELEPKAELASQIGALLKLV